MSNLLAEMVANDELPLVNVSVYYIYKETANGARQIKILSDEVGKEKMEEGDEDVSVLHTKWKVANWEEQNRIIADSQTQPDPMNPASSSGQIDWNRYRDLRVKSLLVEWDLESDNVMIPVTHQNINKMPVEIVVNLYNKYEDESQMDSEDQGK